MVTPQSLASLSVQERMLLFCLASGTDWERAGVIHATWLLACALGFVQHPNQYLYPVSRR